MASRKAGLAELLSAAADGDAAAWEDIVSRHRNLLWSIGRSYRLNPDDCADLVQNTWVRLVRNIQQISCPEALPGWLSTTARREALAILRRQRRDVLVPHEDSRLDAVDESVLQLDARLLDSERDVQLWTCFGLLSDTDQRLLRLLVSCDRPSYAVVAQHLHMPVGSIGPTRMRALKRLHRLMSDSNYAFHESWTPSGPVS